MLNEKYSDHQITRSYRDKFYRYNLPLYNTDTIDSLLPPDRV